MALSIDRYWVVKYIFFKIIIELVRVHVLPNELIRVHVLPNELVRVHVLHHELVRVHVLSPGCALTPPAGADAAPVSLSCAGAGRDGASQQSVRSPMLHGEKGGSEGLNNV